MKYCKYIDAHEKWNHSAQRFFNEKYAESRYHEIFIKNQNHSQPTLETEVQIS